MRSVLLRLDDGALSTSQEVSEGRARRPVPMAPREHGGDFHLPDVRGGSRPELGITYHCSITGRLK